MPAGKLSSRVVKGVRLDHGDASARESLYAEEYHPQHLAKNPNGYCEIGGREVAFRNRVSGVPEALRIISRRGTREFLRERPSILH
jgi:hypothetical protein